MSTSPLSPEDIRAAAEVHRELGPEYSDAVVASFIEKVDREVAARVEARLVAATPTPPAKRKNRRSLVKGLAIGACAGALAATVAVGLPRPSHQVQRQFPAAHGVILRGPGGQIIIRPRVNLPKPPTPPRPPAPPTG
jgi:hypothetical protein